MTPEEKKVAEDAAAAATNEVSKEEFDRLKGEADQLKSTLQEYHKRLTAPEYAAFLAEKAAGGKKKKDPNDDVDLDALSTKELVQYIVTTVKAEMAAGVTDLKNDIALKEAKADIVQARKDHTDFDLYKTEMMALAQTHPTLAVEEVYQLAKTRVGPREVKKPAKIEVPSNSGGTRPKERPKTRAAVMSEAYADVFGKEG